jgi:hypothetical protein
MRSTRRNEVKSLFSSRGNMARAFAIFIASSCTGLLAEEVVAPEIVPPEEVA